MASVRMRDPQGKIWELDDSEQKDALKNGYTPVVQVAAHHRSVPGGAAQASVAAPTAAPDSGTAPDPTAQTESQPEAPAAPKEGFLSRNAESIGGIAGNLLGGGAGPLSSGLAALGGAGGEAYRQIGQAIGGDPNAPDNSLEAIKRIALAGGRQGAEAWAGQKAAKVAGLAGKTVGKWAFEVAKKVSPEAAQTAVDFGVNSAAKLGKVLDKAQTATQDLIQKLTKNGGWHNTNMLANDIYNEAAAQANQAGIPQNALKQLQNYKQMFVENPGNPAHMPSNRLYQIFKTANKGYHADVGGASPASQLWADAERTVARRYLTDAFPEQAGKNALDEALANQHRLMNLSEELGAKKAPSAGARVLGVAGKAAGGAAAGALVPGNRSQHAAAGALLGGFGAPALQSLGAIATNPVLLRMLPHLMNMGATEMNQP